MNLTLLNICIFLCSFLPPGLSEITCGNLKVAYEFKEHIVDCKIRLYPSDNLQVSIRVSHLYRWIFTRNSTPTIILQKNSGTYDTAKYDEENFTLLIRNLSKLDEGRYRVHCWTDRNVNYFSPEVTVKMPDPSEDNTDIQAPGSAPPEAGIGNTALIVISVCAVIIVAIIAGTICLIMWRRKEGTRGVTRLVSDEGTSAIAHGNEVDNNASVYNEIDIDEVIIDYAKEDKRRLKPSKANSRNITTPILGSDNLKAASRRDDNEYDLVTCANALVRESINPDGEYAEVQEICPPETEKVFPSEQKNNFDYAEVTDVKTDSTIAAEDKRNSTGKSENKTSYDRHETGATVPEYAKVSKRKPPNDITKNVETTSVNKIDYKITFPKINCSKLTPTLGEGYPEQEVVKRREPVTYSNLVSRPQREKSRRSRASRRELQYAILDLSEPEREPSDDTTRGTTREESNPPAKVQPCQYATIDFEKKAFVAPIRKAPSSWYRRRNKKGKKRSD